MFETTGHVDRTVLVLWLVGKVLFHLSYEHYMGLQIGGNQNIFKPPPSQGPGTHEKIPIQKNKMMIFFSDTCQHTEPYESVSTFKPSTKVAPTT